MTATTTETAWIPGVVVSRQEWLEARKALLAREKQATRLHDELSRQRRELPWTKLDKDYVFEGPEGPVKLADLFDGRNQLMVYHFMMGPGQKQGCVGCSFIADHVDGARQHFEQNNLSFVAVARAPYADIAAYKNRMGWQFKFVSSNASDFNYDFHVSFRPEELASGKAYYNFEFRERVGAEEPGLSVFFKDAKGGIYHTYSTYGRGPEPLLGAYQFIDFTPIGRNESPNGNLMDWVHRHDQYESDGRLGSPKVAKEGCGCGDAQH
jgi:predicted dithiol-disulfide oxidoreductase (DUF899 family)